MKTATTLSFLAVVAVIGSAGISSAASYTVTNNAGPINTQPLVDSEGNLISGGSAQFGSYFGTTDDQIAASVTSGDILSGFRPFGTQDPAVVAGATIVNGVFTQQNNTEGTNLEDGGSGADFRGLPIYAVIFNGENLDGSEALVVKFDSSFASSEPTVNTVNMNDSTVELIYGGFGNFEAEPSSLPTASPNPAFNTAVLIPEPSVALLGLISGLGVLRRRRRC